MPLQEKEKKIIIMIVKFTQKKKREIRFFLHSEIKH